MKPEIIFTSIRASEVNNVVKYFYLQEHRFKKIYIYTEHKPICLPHNSFIIEDKQKPWGLVKFIRFLTAPNPIDFSEHVPIYDNDISRLSKWRRYYLIGPFTRLVNKTRALPIFSVIIEFIFCLIGLILKLCLPFMRPMEGKLCFSWENIEVCIFYDGGPETDHYGESPVFSDKLDIFEKHLTEEANKTEFPITFLFISGARHLYIERLLKLEDQKKLQNFAIFGRNLYRQKSQEILNQRPEGFFLAGTNTTSSGNIIYSDHCLSVGAGDMELWCYMDSHIKEDLH